MNKQKPILACEQYPMVAAGALMRTETNYPTTPNTWVGFCSEPFEPHI
jgi:hypothetical protein